MSAVHDTGATVIWRCHVGVDHVNVSAREACDFLVAYLGRACLHLLARMGAAAHERVRDHFLGSHHLGLYFELIERLTAARHAPHASPVAGAAGR